LTMPRSTPAVLCANVPAVINHAAMSAQIGFKIRATSL
jgi:hypothetical protein